MKQRIIPLLLAVIAFFAVSASVTYVVTAAVTPVADTAVTSKVINFKGSSGSTATGTLGDQVKTGTDPWQGIWTSTQTGTAPSDLQLKVTTTGGYIYLTGTTSATMYLFINRPEITINFTPTDPEWYVKSIKYTFYARNETTVLETKGEQRNLQKGTNTAVTVDYEETDTPVFNISGLTVPETLSSSSMPYIANVVVTLNKRSGSTPVTPDPPTPDPPTPVEQDVKISVSTSTGSYDASSLKWTSTQSDPTGVTMTGDGLSNTSWYSGTNYDFTVTSTSGKLTFASTVPGYYVSGYTFKALAYAANSVEANGKTTNLSAFNARAITASDIQEGTPAVAVFKSGNANQMWEISAISVTLKKGTGTVTPDPKPDPDPDPKPDPDPEVSEVKLRVNKSNGTFAGNNWTSTQTTPSGAVLMSKGSSTTASTLNNDVAIYGNATTTFTLEATAAGWYVSGYSFDATNWQSYTRTINANGTSTSIAKEKSGTVKVENLEQGTSAIIIFDNNGGTIDWEINNFYVTLKKGVIKEPEPDLEVPAGAFGFYINSSTGQGSSTDWESTERTPGVGLLSSGAAMNYFSSYVYVDFQNSTNTGTLTLQPTPGYYVSDYSFTAVGTLISLSGNGVGPVNANINGEKMTAKDIPVGTPAVINYSFSGSQGSQKNFELRNFRVILKPLPAVTLEAVTLTNASTGQALRLDSATGDLSLSTPDAADQDQLWVVMLNDDHSGEYVRHYATGRYLRVPELAGGRYAAVKVAAPEDGRMLYRLNYANSEKTRASFPLKNNPAGRLLGISGGVAAGVSDSDATAMWNLQASSQITDEMIRARKSDWDANELTRAVEVNKTTGTLTNSEGNTSSVWGSVMTSSNRTIGKLTLSCPANNMQWNGDNLDARTGSGGNSTYTLTLDSPDWYITGYSFVAKNVSANQNVTITTPVNTFTTSANGTQVDVRGLIQDRNVAMTFSGPNSGTLLQDFKVYVAPRKEYNTYRIASKSAGKVLKSDEESGALTLVDPADEDWSQMWVRETPANGEGVYLRNLATGRYLVSPLALDAGWLSRRTPVVDDPSMLMTMDLPALSDEVTIFPRGNAASGVMAAGSGESVVGKTSGDAASVWIWSGVEGVTPEKVASLKAAWSPWPIDLRPGGIYRIKNTLYTDRSMSGGTPGTIYTQPTDGNDYSQLWILEEKPGAQGFYMRNLKTGNLVVASRARSAVWTTQFAPTPNDANMLLNFLPSGSGWYINTMLDLGSTADGYLYGYAHDPSSHDVKGWSNTPASKWDLVEITDLSQDVIDGLKAKWCVTEVKAGKAYRFRNTLYGDLMMENGNLGAVCTADREDDATIWICEETPSGNGFFMRNFSSGRVLQSPRTQNGAWTLNRDYMPADEIGTAMSFPVQTTGLNITTYSTLDQPDSYTFAHENGSKTVLGWVASSTASIWHVEELADITPEVIAEKRLTWDILKDHNLEQTVYSIFRDKACTELLPEYAAMSVEELEAHPTVSLLPKTLRDMVIKVRTDEWAETDDSEGGPNRIRDWDYEHAKKMRVQLYEPYSNSNDVAALFGNYAYNNYCNPTGLLAEKGKKLYVMVDNAPRPNQFLTLHLSYLYGVGDLQGTPGVPLRKGLNVIQVPNDTVDAMPHVCIYNIAKTCDGKTKLATLDEFPDIKIHIEGGVLNGYVNTEGDALYSKDTNEDWLYYSERARSQRFPVISDKLTFILDMFDGVGTSGNFVGMKNAFNRNIISSGQTDLILGFKMFDELLDIELAMMGLVSPETIDRLKARGFDFYDHLGNDGISKNDYHKYGNNKLLFISDYGSTALNATWYRVAYPARAVNGALMSIQGGGNWGVAHEFGHMNQPPVKFAGTTEITVNFFSAVVTHYYDLLGGRNPLPSEKMKNFRSGKNIYNYGLYGQVHMWFQLWAYYHKLGRNRVFSPRLFEMLRQDPIRQLRQPNVPDGTPNPINIKKDLLHFVKKCCEAAGEDLTDFFEATGVFVPLPANGLRVDDYGLMTLYLSQEDIDEVKSEIAAMAAANGWKKNRAIKFLDHRAGILPAAGSMGGFDNFREGSISGTYQYYCTGSTVHVSGGKGAVGFDVRAKDGTLLGYGTDNFEINQKAADMLLAGQADVYAISGNNDMVKLVSLLETDDIHDRKKALDLLMAHPFLRYIDSEERTLGAIRHDVLPELTDLYTELRDMYAKGLIHEYNAEEYCLRLNALLTASCNMPVPESITNQVIDNAVYVFDSNVRHTGVGLKPTDDGSKLTYVKAGEVNYDDPAQQWRFEPLGDGDYALRNIKTGTYLTAPGTVIGKDVTLDVEERKGSFGIISRDSCNMAVSGNRFDASSIVFNGTKVVNGRSVPSDVGTDTDDHKDGRWIIRLHPEWKKINLADDIRVLIDKSEILLTECDDSEEEIAELRKDLREAITVGQENVDEILHRTMFQLMESHDEIEAYYEMLLEKVKGVEGLLTVLVSRTRVLTETVGTVNVTQNAEAPRSWRTPSYFYSNAPHTSGADAFNISQVSNPHWLRLGDKDLSTYFQSDYSGKNSTDGEDHYLRMSIPGVVDNMGVILKYNNRVHGSTVWAPTKFTIQTSADMSEWTDIYTIDHGLPTGSGERYECPYFVLPKGHRYFRFVVHESVKNSNATQPEPKGGHACFSVSEWMPTIYTFNCVPDVENYPLATEQLMREAWTGAMEGERVLNLASGDEQLQEAYENLLPIYQQLLNIIGRQSVDISSMQLRCVDDSDNSKTDFSDVAFAPEGQKVEFHFDGLPAGYPAKEIKVTFTGIDTQEIYAPKGFAKWTEDGYITVNYPKEMPTGRYLVKAVIPATDDFYGYEGENASMEMDVFMKRELREALVAVEGGLSLRYEHTDYLEAKPSHFIFRLAQAPQEGVNLYYKVIPAAQRGAGNRVKRRANVPDDHKLYVHDEGIEIPRNVSDGTISFMAMQHGVLSPAVHIEYQNLPAFDLESGYYLVGSFCDFEVNERAVPLIAQPAAEDIYVGYYNPGEIPTEACEIMFAKYDVTDNSTVFYGPREADVPVYGPGTDMTLSELPSAPHFWESPCGTNDARWTIDASVFSSDLVEGPGLNVGIDIVNDMVYFGADFITITDAIKADSDEVMYFNLDGIRVKNPSKGIYIRVHKGNAQEILIK